MAIPGVVESPHLSLYSRHGCHLCDEMADALASLKQEVAFHVTVLDIDADPVLADRFNDLVPVLMHGDRELARYRLDSGSVRAYLAQIR